MAVIKAKPEKVIENFLPLVQRQLIAPLLVTRVSEDTFKGAEGDKVTVRINKLRTRTREYNFRGRTAPIQMDDISGGEEFEIKIDKHVYTATSLEDEHMTLDDVSYTREVLAPQTDAIAADYEARVVQGLYNVDAKQTLSIDADDDPYLVALEAKRLMDSWKTAPSQGRVLLAGSNVAAAWLATDRLTRYDSTGQSGTPALRDAIIGKLASTAVVEIPELDPNKAFYMHPSSLVLASVAPDVPRGVSTGAKVSKNGYGMRYIVDYDANYLRDRSIVSTFLGMNEIKDERYLTDGYHDPETGENVSSGTAGAVEHRAGDIKHDAVAKNARIIPINLSGFTSVLA